MDSVNAAQGRLMDQLTRIMNIPSGVVHNWPAWFSFSLVNYISAIALNAVPNMGGVAGTIINAGVNGAAQTINHVTWEAVKASGK